MKRCIKYCFSLILLSVLCLSVSAQHIVVPYQCGFEDPEENANWTLNVGTRGSQCMDQWIIGQSTFNEGNQSLYISDDGVSAEFGHKPNIVAVSRTFTIDRGNYELSFDWKNLAVGNSGLYVCLVRQGSSNMPDSDPSTWMIPQWLEQSKYIVRLSDGTDTDCLASRQEWTSSSVEFLSPNATTRLTLSFVWVNANTDTAVLNPIGACIDNIQIVSNVCRKPYNLKMEQVSCDSTFVSWSGFSEKYALEYRPYGETEWTRIENIVRSEYLLTGLSENTYDIRVQSVLQENRYSAWAILNSQPVFCPMNHCINIVDLHSPSITCHIRQDLDGKVLYDSISVVDYGAESIYSRHTVNTIRNQFDPRTGNKLRTIPAGELFSVRLGNWNAGGESERMNIKYHVDCSSASILLMKYAVVLEDPSHEPEFQPYFSVTLINESTKDTLNPTCCAVEFFADSSFVDDGWNRYVGKEGSDQVILWKDWTSFGLNLQDFDGMDIIISLETRDCAYFGHFGYAYFTLGCASGEIQNMNCGTDPGVELKAPDGFDYIWYTESVDDPVPDGDSIVLKIDAADTDTYHCRCLYKENHDCYFELSTVVTQRNAFAEYDYRWEPRDCRNMMRLIDKSHVVTVDKTTGEIVHTDEPCQYVEWFLEDGTVLSKRGGPLVEMPDSGGHLSGYMKAYISNGKCYDSIPFSIDIPSIVSDFVIIDTTMCDGWFMEVGNIKFRAMYEKAAYQEVIDYGYNIAGCDSSTLLKVTVYPPIEEIYVKDTICAGDTLRIGNRVFTESCADEEVWFDVEGPCDSIVHLNLVVIDDVEFIVKHGKEAVVAGSGWITLDDVSLGDGEWGWTVNGERVLGDTLTCLVGGEYKVVVYNEKYDNISCPSDTSVVSIMSECLEIDVDIPERVEVCADEEGIIFPFHVNSGILDGYAVVFGDNAVNAGFEDFEVYADTIVEDEFVIMLPDSCLPGHYNAELVVRDAVCDWQRIPFSFSVYYPSYLLQQKWMDVIAIKNSEYNGGYRFSAFRWYCNGIELPDETGPYLYVGPEARLDTASVYHAVVTRSSDGVTVPICGIKPKIRSDVQPYPVLMLVENGSVMRVMNVARPGIVRLYTSVGQLLWKSTLDGDTDIPLPDVSGVYIMRFEFGAVMMDEKVIVH